MRLIDTHAHLDFPEYNADRTALIANLKKLEIGVVNISTSLESIPEVVKLATENELIWGMIGIHPTDITSDILLKLPELIKSWEKIFEENHKIVGIGEIGLDYFHDRSTEAANRQKAALRQFLTFSQEKNLPVSFHCRDAYGDLITILRDYDGLRGVIHCFSGSVSNAEAFIEAGMMISFTGMITYPKNEELRAVVEKIPLEKIMLETDSPFLSPQDNRGNRNDPRSVENIASLVAQLKHVSVEEAGKQTTMNAINFFNHKE